MSLSRRGFLRLGMTLGAAKALTIPPLALGTSETPLFREVAPLSSGIEWVHENAMSDNRYLPETLGPGCAFLDYDNDGWMDIYLVNGGPCDFWTPAKPVHNALYKNNRDGTFTDVTERAGVATPGWTTSAVWFDFDNDGLLDLFICSFVDYGAKQKLACGDNQLGNHYYCIPRAFSGTSSFLYHNNGDGTFSEVSKGTDIARATGKALGVVATDINNDGRMDLFVANDTVQNFLFVNRGANRWEEIAVSAEVGFSENGQARSGMGVDSADLNGDGWEDLFVANVDQEMFSVYKNNKSETFRDTARTHSVAQATRLLSGWGLKFYDYDNDGEIDLILANGHPDDMIENYSQQVKYQEPLLLFHQEGRKLKNVSAQAGPAFAKSYPARGLAVGDLSNNGKLDVLVANCGAAPLLLRNNSGAGNHWLGVHLRGEKCNRDGIGCRLTWSAGGTTRSRLKNSGGSYLSSHDPRVVLGVGAAEKLDWLEVKWAGSGKGVERFTDLPIDRY